MNASSLGRGDRRGPGNNRGQRARPQAPCARTASPLHGGRVIPFDQLLASALGELAGDADLDVETHVLSCTSCAATYASLLRLGPAIGAHMRGGTASMTVARGVVERLEAERLVSR